MSPKEDYPSDLKSTNSASAQMCDSCGRTIQANEEHYGFRPKGQIFNFVRKRFCKECIEKHGAKVIGMKKPSHSVKKGPIDEYG